MCHVPVLRASLALCLATLLTIALEADPASALELGTELVVAAGVAAANSDTTNPGRPAVGFDGTNYLVVTCRSLGSPSGLIGVIVSPTGVVLGTVPIAAVGCPVQQAAVAFDGANYLVVFAREGQIVGTRVSPSGTVLDASSFPISSGMPYVVTNWFPAVAFDGANYLVVWSKFNNGYDIYGARVTPAGQVLGEFHVFRAPGEQVDPSVSFDGGNYLVVWRDTRSGSGPASDTDIYGARVTRDGVVLDPGGIAISTAPDVQGSPHVAFGAGSYFVVWGDLRSDPRFASGYGLIFGARVSPDGVLLDGPPDTGGIPIHTAPQSKGNAVVAFDGANYLVAWQVGAYSLPAGIFAARVSPAGQLLDGPSDTGAVHVSAPSCFGCRLFSPSLTSGGETSLLTWVNNAELQGTNKDVMGASICRAVALDEPASPCFGVSSADYLPLAPGTTWTYRDDGGSMFTSTVLDQSVIVNGVAARVVQDSRDGSQELYTNDTNGVRLHRTFDPQTFIPGLGTVDLTTTFEPPIQLARATMRVGTIVRSSGSAVTNPLPIVGVQVLSYTASATLRSVETVTVPAGTFEVVRLDVVVTLSGPGVSESSTTVFSAARSLGIARRMTTDAEGTETIELVTTSARPVLTVRRAGSGSGTVASVPGGIACGADCSETFDGGTVVTLTATPTPDSMFTGWSGGGCSGTGTCTITLRAGAGVTATFALKPVTLTVTRVGAGSGTVTSTPAGIACGPDCTKGYASGTRVDLVATADASSVFSGWTGGGCSGSGPCRLVVTADTVVTATFVVPTFPLTVARAGTGSGSVTSMPGGIACGNDCGETYTNGVSVVLTATRDSGSVFAGWAGACSGTGSCTVVMDAAKSVTATFVPATFLLSVHRVGDGNGTVVSDPGGINCGINCETAYTSGTPVTLTATASPGSVFGGWTGACAESGPICMVLMLAAKSVTAEFMPQRFLLTVSRAGPGSGSVASASAGIACGSDCEEPYTNGTTVTLTATPDPDSTFAGWLGGCAGRGPCTLTVNGPRSVTAIFLRAAGVRLTVRLIGGPGLVTGPGIRCGLDCTGQYPEGTLVTLTATPGAGAVFKSWSGGCTGTGSCTVSMQTNRRVTATFTRPRLFALGVRRAGAGGGTVTSAPTGVACGADCVERYVANTEVTLTAVPDPGSVFAGWSGACTGTGPCTVTMRAARVVTATFARAP